MIKKQEDLETRLYARSRSDETQIVARIVNGVVKSIVLKINKNRGSSLPVEFKEINLPGEFRQLSDIATLSKEMVDAIIAERQNAEQNDN